MSLDNGLCDNCQKKVGKIFSFFISNSKGAFCNTCYGLLFEKK